MKAVKGVRRGEDIREVSGKYDVTIYTVYRSLRKAEEGDLKARPRKEAGKLSYEQRGRLLEMLERGSREYGLNYDLWSLKFAAYVMEREF